MDGRTIDFNLAVSTGQELCVGMHDYLDFALDLPGTRAVGLFMETFAAIVILGVGAPDNGIQCIGRTVTLAVKGLGLTGPGGRL